jgi:hypothetical protein
LSAQKTKAKKTPEEIAEENERTNEVGLFNRADAYLLCAKQLIENPPAHLRFDAPIDFLFFHAAELLSQELSSPKGRGCRSVEAFRALSPADVQKGRWFWVKSFASNLGRL